MKKYTSLVMVTLGLFLLPAISAQAQRLRATVPFDFSVGAASMPAGDYFVSKDLDAARVLRITPDHGGGAFMVTTLIDGPANDEGRLVFNQYGDQYFLSQVWDVGVDAGHRLRPSKLEREIAKSMGKPELKTVAAKK